MNFCVYPNDFVVCNKRISLNQVSFRSTSVPSVVPGFKGSKMYKPSFVPIARVFAIVSQQVTSLGKERTGLTAKAETDGCGFCIVTKSTATGKSRLGEDVELPCCPGSAAKSFKSENEVDRFSDSDLGNLS